MVMEKAGGWKGGKTKCSTGYIEIKSPLHPNKNKAGYVKKHVLVMELHIGRYLKPKEVVHHINEIRDDNRIENLQLCKDTEEHSRFHKGWWKKDGKWFKVCRDCVEELEVNKENFYKRGNGRWFFICKKCAKKTNNERNRNKLVPPSLLPV
jgi:superfamily II helicase